MYTCGNRSQEGIKRTRGLRRRNEALERVVEDVRVLDHTGLFLDQVVYVDRLHALFD